MSLISEINKKSRHNQAPILEISQEQATKLKRGKVVIIDDIQTGESYLIRIKNERMGIGSLTQTDLEIEKINLHLSTKNSEK